MSIVFLTKSSGVSAQTCGYTKAVLGLPLTTLIFSTVVMGYGTHIGKVTKENEMRQIDVSDSKEDLLEKLGRLQCEIRNLVENPCSCQ